MTVRGVDDHDVNTGIEQRPGALEFTIAGPASGGDAQPAVRVLGGVRVKLRLFDVLDRDQPDTAIGIIADSGEVARSFRHHVARCSDMMSPA